MAEVIEVWRKSPVRLAPIRVRVHELEQTHQISAVCRQAGLSRNQLYLMLRGRTNTREETLTRLLCALGLTWEEVACAA